MRNLKIWSKNNKLVTILAFILVLEGILYFLFGHPLIEAIYKAQSIDFLNNMFKGRENNSLDFYLKRSDLFFVFANTLFACLVLVSYFFLKIITQKIPVFYLAKIELVNFKASLIKNKKAILLSTGLAIGFSLLYITIGIPLIQKLLLNPNIFDFLSPNPGDLHEWTSLEYNKHHKGSHPLILLLVSPWQSLLTFSPLPKEVSAVLISSFFGSFAILFAALCFWNLTKKYIETLLLTILFGLTMNQLFYSTIPESRSLQCLSIIPTYLLFIVCLQSKKLYLVYWILAGLFSFGVTITNFAQTLICFFAIVLVVKQRNRVSTILEYVGVIVSLSFLLSLLQHKLFGGQYFFIPDMLTTELKYVRPPLASNTLLIPIEIFKNFFLVNFVSPSPVNHINYSDYMMIIPGEKLLYYSIIGLMALLIWGYVFTLGVYQNITNRNQKNQGVFVLVIFLVILFNMAFHSFFNNSELFIHTSNFTFPVLLIAINGWLLQKTYFKIALISLIILMGINNLSIIVQIISS